MVVGLLASAIYATASYAQTPQLDDRCIVSVLNRNVRVKPDGTWLLPNIPANFGLVRAQATCVFDGLTVSGESAPFLVSANESVDAPPWRGECESSSRWDAPEHSCAGVDKGRVRQPGPSTPTWRSDQRQR
jgi:hypothetical protein